MEEPMKKNNLKQQAYQIIKQKIINCEYTPGMLLNENMLLESVPGSRTPVRDALGRLEQEKLITILPKKGILISNLSVKDLIPIYETRLLLEPYTVLHYGNTLTDEFYMEYYDKFSSTETVSDVYAHYLLDDQFHLAFIEASKNAFFMQTYEQIHAQTHRSRVLTGNITKERLEHSQKEHLDIVIPCLQKDWELAADRMRQHLNTSRTSVLKELSQKYF